MATNPVVVSGCSRGAMSAAMLSSALGGGWRTSTGIGLASWPGTDVDWAAGDHVLRSVKLFAEILKDVGGSLESSARCRRAAQRSDLLTHGELVARKITCELRDLCRDHATDEKDACEREQDDTDD